MITRPVRERPADQVRTMVARRPAPHRLRRGRAHVAVDARTSPASTRSSPTLVDDPDGQRQRQPSRCRRLRVDAFTVGHRHRDPEGPPHRPHVRARGRHVADAPGHQQADHRGGPVRRGRVRLLAGLAPGEAVLPHRPADRDRRGHARHRRAGPQRASRSAGATPRARRCTVSVGGFVPKPHTPFQWFGQNTVAELQPQDRPAARRSCARPRRPAQVARPQGHAAPRASPAGATAGIGAGHRAGVAATAAPSRSGREHFDLDLLERRHGRHGPRSTGTCTATAPTTRCCRGTTSRPASTRTSSGRTGRTPWPSVGLARLPLDAVLRLRGVHRLRHRARRGLAVAPAGGSQGTGQDLTVGGAVPVTFLSGAGSGGARP